MKIHFDKMQGLGNDFVVINGYHQEVNLAVKQIRHLADRRYGIGCDQVLVLRKPYREGTHFGYQIFNATGEEVGQCGNGARCLASFISHHKITSHKKFTLSTINGELEVELMSEEQVRVNMGFPRFAVEEIPVDLEKLLQKGWQQSIEHPAKLIGCLPVNDMLPAGLVSMGNPHLVFHLANLDEVSIASIGREFSFAAMFPEQSNVGLMQVADRNHLLLKVYERHVGETQACGSGACAAVVIGRLQGFLDDIVKVTQPGGDLIITWQGDGHAVWMQGPAKRVFSGEIEL